MVTHSLRWRLQLWLAFLLVVVLSGFCAAVYQLQRLNQFKQIDEELRRRVAALSTSLRGGPPPELGPGHFRGGPGRGEGGPNPDKPPPSRGDFGPERADFDDGPSRPPPLHDSPGGPRFGGPRDMWLGPREFRLSGEAASLFDETRANSFYY